MGACTSTLRRDPMSTIIIIIVVVLAVIGLLALLRGRA
jgi:hypothetical protein